jgi:predicted DNA-binding transcriptional regulator YafY
MGMDRTERFYKIETLLHRHRAVSFGELQAALEVSRATVRRDLDYLRTRLNLPIEWSREAAGYRFVPAAGGAEQSHMTHLWFSSAEIHALLTMRQLLGSLDTSGVLAFHIAPLQDRLTALLGKAGPGQDEAAQLRRRVRVVGMAQRTVQPKHFQRVGTALLQRKRLRIVYRARGTGNTTEREVSPLRLMHYRGNWHLDAWCHLRKGLRNFAVDAIQEAKEVSDAKLDATFGPSYGIFSGNRIRWARLRFTPERARWVANETWHPQQRGRWDDDSGHWLLDVPYADPRELVKDILQHVPDVEVLGPPGLRQEVRQRMEQGLRRLDAAG